MIELIHALHKAALIAMRDHDGPDTPHLVRISAAYLRATAGSHLPTSDISTLLGS
jgi:hypothetical protein